tara:strand:+ start:153 stop:920 length:768 start_codon:yes stop_codon:yes gene_type:complete
LIPVDFEKLYGDFIDAKNEENRQERYVGKENYYRASSSGFCSRKIYYESIEQAPQTDMPKKANMRIMRLGTVIHDDLQKALIYYNNINKESIKNKEKEIKNKQKEKFHVEGNVEIPELNVRGHYDVVLEGDKVYLFDFKTASSWSYRMKFGKKKEFDPSISYELQLGTYGYAIKEKFGRLDGMYLVYYNKDNSQMNYKEVSTEFVLRAYNFWYNIGQEHKMGLPSFRKGVSPVKDWNCSYCAYYSHCKPPIKRRT